MKIVSKNKKSLYDNEIIEKFIAGIVLTGAEVKSIKTGQAKIDGAYVFVNPDRAIVRNMHVPLWQRASLMSSKGYVPDRDRVLLLTKKQLMELYSKRQQLRAQVIPVALGIENNLVKLEVALGRPLKKYEKKNRKKEREEKLAVQRIAKTVEVRM